MNISGRFFKGHLVKTVLSVLLLCFVFTHSKATHVAGVDFNYECLGGDSFLISFNIFRDCSGIDAPPDVDIDFLSPCDTFAATLPLDSVTSVSPLCPEDDSNSTCFGGSLPGIEHYWYSGVVEIPQCPSGAWEMSWNLCCRNPSNNLVGSPNGPTFFVESILDNGAAPCNNSPVFNAAPIPYFCKDIPVVYNFSVTDPDGDSLYYTLDTALQSSGGGSPASYQGSYHGADPFDVPVSLDSVTGQVQFTPATNGLWVIKVCANEYRNGVFIGKICRDIQFVIVDCENYPPYMEEPGITNLEGEGTLTSNTSLDVCAGDSVKFDVFFGDSLFPTQQPGNGDSISFQTNISTVLPGAVVSTQSGNPAKLSLEWVASVGSNPLKNIFVEAIDNACPIRGVNGRVLSIRVNESAYAGEDQQICAGSDTAFLEVEGGNHFTWSVISGDPIQPGVNFIDTTGLSGDSVWASPGSVTTYRVQSDLTSFCGNDDTITVFAARDFELDMFGDTVVCTHDASTGFPIEVIPDTSAGAPYGFSYQWSNPADLDNDTVPNPVASPSQGIQKNYTVTVTSDSGCVKTGTVNVGFHPDFPDSLRIDFEYNPLCLGDSTPAVVDFGLQADTTCGVTGEECIGKAGNGYSGDDQTSNGPNDENTPYINADRGSRIQFLYKAQELNSMGMIPGTRISAISFYVQARNGMLPLEDYEIKIGCTEDTSLTNSWSSDAASSVYFDPLLQIQSGWNTHQFDSLYRWDGSSNLIVEICHFNSSNSNTTNNASVRFTPTPGFTSVRATGSSSTSVCTGTSADYTGDERPNTGFDYCNPYDPDAYLISWSPSASLSANQGDSLIAFPDTTTEYTVTVEDTSGNCNTQLVNTLEVITEYDVSFSFSDPICLDSDPDTADVATPGGVFDGTGIIDTLLGVFDPSGLSHDTFDISYTMMSHTGNCFSSDTVGVAVVPAPPTNFTGPQYFCTGNDSVVYRGDPDNGVWSMDSGVIDAQSGVLDAATLPGYGTYDIIYDRSAPCARTDTLTVTAYIPPTAGLDTLFEVCNNDSLQLFADTVTGVPHDTLLPRFNWFGPGIADAENGILIPDTLSPGIYPVHLRLTDSANTCSDTVTGNYRVLRTDTPQIIDPLAFCADEDTVALNIAPQLNSDSGSLVARPISFTDDTLVFEDSTLFNPDPYDSASWELTYSYTNGFGCSASTFDTLSVLPLPGDPDITPDGFCAGEEVVLSARGSDIDSVYWFVDSLHLIHSPAGKGVSFNAGAGDTGTQQYYAVAWRGKCMGQPVTHEVTVLDYPEAKFDLEYETFSRETKTVRVTEDDVRDEGGYFVPGRKVLSSFPADVTGFALEQPIPDEDTIHWNFDFESDVIDRENAWVYDEPVADYSYIQRGTYKIKMIRVNRFGCIDSTHMFLELINGEESPNVFTPNGDGVNDEFKLLSAEGIEDYRISVYNRWGILIWEETVPQIGWNGRTFSGEEVSDGVYYFIATGNYPSGSEYNRKGYIQLMK